MNFNHENQKTLELRTEDAKDCDEWVAAIAHARYQGLPHAIRVSLLLHPTPAMRVGQWAAGLPLGIAKMVGNGIVGVGIAVLGRIGAASAGGRTDGEEGMATWGACGWLRCVQLSVSCLWVLLCCVSGGCGVPGAPGATLRAVSAHSYRTLATEHEALMQKYLHLLQIVETEKTVAKQLRQQIEDGEIEIERLKAEVRGGPGAAAGTAGTVLRADGGLCHMGGCVTPGCWGGGSAGWRNGSWGGMGAPCHCILPAGICPVHRSRALRVGCVRAVQGTPCLGHSTASH